MVVLAWQVYALSNAPTALGLVSLAMTVPTIVCLLFGGAASDRLDRRRLMLVADSVRALAVGALAVLSAVGALVVWEVAAVAVVYGAATAFFNPAFDAIAPEVLPAEVLAQANSLDQLIRPLALRLAGPALGGVIVGVLGNAGGFAFDAGSFVISGCAVLAMARPPRRAAERSDSMIREIVTGWRYVRRHAWLWATFASATIAYLLFMGPTEVLLPYVVKNHLSGGASDLGIIYAAGGLGSLLCALLIGQVGLPRRSITFMYLTWTVATLAVAGYGVLHSLWGLMLVSVVFNSLETAGTIAWGTAKQKHVPTSLLGRVSSLDWLISIGLLPVSFALTGPVSAAIGVRTTMIAAGTLGAIVTLAAMFVPGTRVLEQDVRRTGAEVAAELGAERGVVAPL
jgi:DHA3 family tetracycline resistance protein-like MFS transporter